MVRRILQADYRKHLAADLEHQIISPQHDFGRLWERETVGSDLFDVHLHILQNQQRGLPAARGYVQ